MINLTRPIGDISFQDWAASIQVDLNSSLAPIHPDVNNWWDWASQLLVDNQLGNAPLPLRGIYPGVESWSDWAAFFIDSISNN